MEEGVLSVHFNRGEGGTFQEQGFNCWSKWSSMEGRTCILHWGKWSHPVRVLGCPGMGMDGFWGVGLVFNHWPFGWDLTALCPLCQEDIYPGDALQFPSIVCADQGICSPPVTWVMCACPLGPGKQLCWGL